MKTKSQNQWKTARRIDPFMVGLFECPECQKTVSVDDFITSYRMIEGSNPPSYQIKNLCRKCRDSGK